MDIGKINDNYLYYTGFEDEPEIVMELADHSLPTLHIWDGYFLDLFGNPPLDGKGWIGFTRDYNQLEGVFENYNETVLSDPQEYLDDLLQYEGKPFQFDETKNVLQALREMLRYAVDTSRDIIMNLY